jgi:hypothetical protein
MPLEERKGSFFRPFLPQARATERSVLSGCSTDQGSEWDEDAPRLRVCELLSSYLINIKKSRVSLEDE